MGDHSAWWVDDHSAWVGKEVEDHFKVYLITQRSFKNGIYSEAIETEKTN